MPDWVMYRGESHTIPEKKLTFNKVTPAAKQHSINGNRLSGWVLMLLPPPPARAAGKIARSTMISKNSGPSTAATWASKQAYPMETLWR